MTQPKIKVETAKLLAEVRKEKTRAKAEYEKQIVFHANARQRHEKQIVAKLKRALVDAQCGKFPAAERYGNRVKLDLGEAPRKPEDRSASFDQAIRTLEMAADPAISISADDYARYLGRRS